jgi:hypothetical protein
MATLILQLTPLRFVERRKLFFEPRFQIGNTILLVDRVRGQECPRHTTRPRHTNYLYLIVTVSNWAPLTT